MSTRSKKGSAPNGSATEFGERDVFDETMFDAVPDDEPEEATYSDLQYAAVAEGEEIKG